MQNDDSLTLKMAEMVRNCLFSFLFGFIVGRGLLEELLQSLLLGQ